MGWPAMKHEFSGVLTGDTVRQDGTRVTVNYASDSREPSIYFAVDISFNIPWGSVGFDRLGVDDVILNKILC